MIKKISLALVTESCKYRFSAVELRLLHKFIKCDQYIYDLD